MLIFFHILVLPEHWVLMRKAEYRFSRLFRGRNSCHCFCVELVKLLLVHRYSVDIFSYSSPSGTLGSDAESRIPLKPVLGGVRIVAFSINSHEQTP